MRATHCHCRHCLELRCLPPPIPPAAAPCNCWRRFLCCRWAAPVPQRCSNSAVPHWLRARCVPRKTPRGWSRPLSTACRHPPWPTRRRWPPPPSARHSPWPGMTAAPSATLWPITRSSSPATRCPMVTAVPCWPAAITTSSIAPSSTAPNPVPSARSFPIARMGRRCSPCPMPRSQASRETRCLRWCSSNTPPATRPATTPTATCPHRSPCSRSTRTRRPASCRW